MRVVVFPRERSKACAVPVGAVMPRFALGVASPPRRPCRRPAGSGQPRTRRSARSPAGSSRAERRPAFRPRWRRDSRPAAPRRRPAPALAAPPAAPLRARASERAASARCPRRRLPARTRPVRRGTGVAELCPFPEVRPAEEVEAERARAVAASTSTWPPARLAQGRSVGSEAARSAPPVPRGHCGPDRTWRGCGVPAPPWSWRRWSRRRRRRSSRHPCRRAQAARRAPRRAARTRASRGVIDASKSSS